MAAFRSDAREYDAIVVGSGISGGWAAKELCERGLRTLVLEAGPAIAREGDYGEHIQPWELPFRGRGDRHALDRDQPIQRRACDEWTAKWFVNDRENPYTNDPDKPFIWIRGRHVGGRSLMWGRQVYRWSDLDFEANAREGIGIDWPIRYADIAPWYDHVERFIGVSGQAEGLAHLPDGRFLPPMPLRCAEQTMRQVLRDKWGGERMLTIGRCAILTRPHNGRAACHYCGPCWRGCITHSYFSSNGSTLPAAERTGRLTLRPDSVVESVLYDEKRDRVTGVRLIDGHTRKVLEFRARGPSASWASVNACHGRTITWRFTRPSRTSGAFPRCASSVPGGRTSLRFWKTCSRPPRRCWTPRARPTSRPSTSIWSRAIASTRWARRGWDGIPGPRSSTAGARVTTSPTSS